MSLNAIDTIVYLMLENRSFDHMLGYLSSTAAQPAMPVEGIRDTPAWLDAHDNFYQGQRYPIHRLFPATQRIDDPPHEEQTIHTQITTPIGDQPGSCMGGFVASYMTRQPPPQDPSAVMGYYAADAVPAFDFLARNFAVCDHWFSALPTGTQANRLMAMSGESRVLDNVPVFLPEQPLVYDWLTAHKVSWCAYQSGDFFPFFSLMPHWLPEIVSSLSLSDLGARGRFRRYSRFHAHWLDSRPMPSVIFLEPEYTDGPHGDPNDDHPPTGVAKGQEFVATLYATLIANPQRWQRSMLVITYDEHGGFFDHVPPLPIATEVAGVRLASTGVRVPALVVSPYVQPGSVFSRNLDHTSFLHLLAQRFSPGQAYSAAVTARQQHLAPLSAILTDEPVAGAPPLPTNILPQLRNVATPPPPAGSVASTAGAAANDRALRNVALKVKNDHPELLETPGWRRLAQFDPATAG